MHGNLNTQLLADFTTGLADARRPLGTFAPLPGHTPGAEPLCFRFDAALAAVELTGDPATDLAALDAAAERFGATLGVKRQAWTPIAMSAIEDALRRAPATIARRAA